MYVTNIPLRRRRILGAWFWVIAAMTLGVLIVGGATRLTHSGLSMVEWDPIMGVIPPLSDADWQEAFEKYRQYPEYQKLRQGMTVQQFKFIFFWEYMHRLLARMIGVVFLLPFAFFLARRWMNRSLALRSLALFALGGMQGVMGWLMVASGLVDRPSVSHYRLAAHLSLAFMIFGYAVWLARDMSAPEHQPVATKGTRRLIKSSITMVGVLLIVQIIWGAFVAGLKAGFFANTFPLMGGRWVPATVLDLEPALRNFVENGVTVQWMHRLLGTLLVMTAMVAFARIARANVDQASRKFALAFLVLIGAQYLLGVFTLLHAVPVALGVTHQAVAMVIFGVWVMWLHYTVRLVEPRNTRPDAQV